MAIEIWKDIPGYEGLYQASNLGRIKSLPRYSTRGKVLRPNINKHNGYAYVSLSKHNHREQKRVHVLVMSAFSPKSKKPGYDRNCQIDHINGDKTDNRLSNLEWVTQRENQLRAYALGLNGKSTKQVIDLDTKEVFDSLSDASLSVGGKKVSPITRVCKGVRSQYRNHRFAYYEDYLNGTIPVFKGKYRKGSCEQLWR